MEVVPPTWEAYREQSLTPYYTTQDRPGRSPDAQQKSNPTQQEYWNKTVPLSRGRAPGDPQAQPISFHCQNIEDLKTNLHDYLANPNPVYPPAHAAIKLIFPIIAAYLVADPFAHSKTGPKLAQAPPTMISVYGTLNSTVISAMDAMTPMPDPKDKYEEAARHCQRLCRSCPAC